MRHGHGLRKLNRTSEHRLAMLRNMCVSLLQHEQHALNAFECGVGYYPGSLGNFIHADFDSSLGGRRRWGPGRG